VECPTRSQWVTGKGNNAREAERLFLGVSGRLVRIWPHARRLSSLGSMLGCSRPALLTAAWDSPPLLPSRWRISIKDSPARVGDGDDKDAHA